MPAPMPCKHCGHNKSAHTTRKTGICHVSTGWTVVGEPIPCLCPKHEPMDGTRDGKEMVLTL
jgi:hypothetical protein